jgi:hypothetical protein
LISPVLIDQQGFDVEFGKHAVRVSAAPGNNETRNWVKCLLSPIADAQIKEKFTKRQTGNGQI